MSEVKQKKLQTKTLYGITFKVIDFKPGEDIIMPGENVYLQAELVEVRNVKCDNLFVKGNIRIKSNQDVRGNQDES